MSLTTRLAIEHDTEVMKEKGIIPKVPTHQEVMEFINQDLSLQEIDEKLEEVIQDLIDSLDDEDFLKLAMDWWSKQFLEEVKYPCENPDCKSNFEKYVEEHYEELIGR